MFEQPLTSFNDMINLKQGSAVLLGLAKMSKSEIRPSIAKNGRPSVAIFTTVFIEAKGKLIWEYLVNNGSQHVWPD